MIRHSLKARALKNAIRVNLDEYQKIQKQKFFDGCNYLLSFISEPGTSVKFMGCYKVGQGQLAFPALMPDKFPLAAMFNSGDYYFDLKKPICDLRERLR